MPGEPRCRGRSGADPSIGGLMLMGGPLNQSPRDAIRTHRAGAGGSKQQVFRRLPSAQSSHGRADQSTMEGLHRWERAQARGGISPALNIRMAGPERSSESVGGNQQKVVLARWRPPEGADRDDDSWYRRRAKSKYIICCSERRATAHRRNIVGLAEVMTSDRIGLMREGRVTGGINAQR
jgi:hypothetical protein